MTMALHGPTKYRYNPLGKEFQIKGPVMTRTVGRRHWEWKIGENSRSGDSFSRNCVGVCGVNSHFLELALISCETPEAAEAPWNQTYMAGFGFFCVLLCIFPFCVATRPKEKIWLRLAEWSACTFWFPSCTSTRPSPYVQGYK